jgi:hypothetical protein
MPGTCKKYVEGIGIESNENLIMGEFATDNTDKHRLDSLRFCASTEKTLLSLLFCAKLSARNFIRKNFPSASLRLCERNVAVFTNLSAGSARSARNIKANYHA